MSPLKITNEEYEKIKCDSIYDKILNFKEIRKELPTCILLRKNDIPTECRAEMSITVDDVEIPIIELEERAC